jgi:PAS domain S-box-containing protein
MPVSDTAIENQHDVDLKANGMAKRNPVSQTGTPRTGTPRSILRLLMPSLSLALLTLTATCLVLLWFEYKQEMTKNAAIAASEVARDLRLLLKEQATALSMTAQPIAADQTVQRALREGDADTLLKTWLPVFEKLKQSSNLTHFYFFDKNRTCLLRIHKPDFRGDRINRVTAMTAEQTGQPASGVEIGPLGTFTLRVVQPIFESGKLVGYVELGKEIEDVLTSLCDVTKSEFAIVINKDFLVRQNWETGMKMLGRQGDWDRHPNGAVIYSTAGRILGSASSWVDHVLGSYSQGKKEYEYPFEGRSWQISTIPIEDVSGTNVGDLLVAHDASPERAALVRQMIVYGIIGGGLLPLLLFFVRVMCRRTDKIIQDQQISLQNSEQKLRDESTRLKSLLEVATDGVHVIDSEGDVVLFSPSFAEMLGYSPEEMAGMNVADFDVSLPKDELISAINDDFKTPGVVETQHRRKDGVVLEVEIITRPVYLDGKKLLYASSRDITSRKRNEKELIESKALADQAKNEWELTFNSITDCIMILDKNYRALHANMAALRRRGLQLEAAIGMHCYEIVGCNQHNTANCPHAKMIASESEEICEMAMNMDGKTYGIKVTPVVDSNNNVFGIVHVMRDITDLKKAEDAINNERLRLEHIVDGTHAGTWEWNVQTGEAVFNERWAEIVGYDLEELSPVSIETWSSLAHPDDLAKSKELLAKHFAGELVSYDLECRMKHKDGHWVWVHDSGKVASISSDGKPLMMYGIHQDISERKKIEQEMITARDQAMAGMHAKSEFLANMSHEIRTPLNGIVGMLHLMGMTSLDEEQNGYILVAEKSSTRLTQLLSDILDLSRFEHGVIPVKDAPFVIKEIEQSLKDLFGVSAKEKGINLLISIDGRLPRTLIGDEARLMQVLFNVVGNAIKFTDKGSVSIGIAQLAIVNHSRLRVLFTVADNGVGITDGMLGVIFEPFVQGELSLTKRFQGAGLGLSIVRKLVAAMGGDIAIDNSEGVGTKFYISIPFNLPANYKKMNAMSVSPPISCSIDRHRILLVEDDEMNLHVGKHLLEKLGHYVTTAKDGEEALRIFDVHDFDLIIMDLQMPIMNGIDATRAIRTSTSMGAKSKVPIIAMTGFAMPGDKERFMDEGLTDYITKPVNWNIVVEKIALHVGNFHALQ